MASRAFTYTVVYEHDPETGYICASVPVLDLATHGRTLEEARLMAREALELHLEGLLEEKMPVPPDAIRVEAPHGRSLLADPGRGQAMKASKVIRILLHNGFIERKGKGGHRQFVLGSAPQASGDRRLSFKRCSQTRSAEDRDSGGEEPR